MTLGRSENIECITIREAKKREKKDKKNRKKEVKVRKRKAKIELEFLRKPERWTGSKWLYGEIRALSKTHWQVWILNYMIIGWVSVIRSLMIRDKEG